MSQTSTGESRMITNIFDALPIVEESTTSRVLVNNPLMRVVYFSFDKGQLLTAHSSPRAVVVTILKGAMDFTVNDKTSRMVAGDCCYLAPSDVHALVAVEPTYMALTMVDVKAAGHDAE